MSWVAVGAIVIGTGLTVYSMYSQGRAQQYMSNYNAMIARQNAELMTEQMKIATKEKEIAAERHQRGVGKVIASQKALWAKAGVDMAGTPLVAEAQTLTEAELDALAIRYAGTVEQSQMLDIQSGLKQQETLERMRGSAYAKAGYLGAGSSLLTGMGQAYGMLTPAKTPKVG
ncbi:MAG: hypothetical protein WA066_02990 [Candidatus Omnitrophota bacterium]